MTMSDEVIDGLWVKAAPGWRDEDTVGVYINLRQADGLVARRSGKSGRFHIYAAYGFGEAGEPAVTVPLDLPERTYPGAIEKDLDKLARVINSKALSAQR